MKNRGMTLFIAVVIMGILLFISFAVVNITLKGTLFASSGRDSQYAFYAADAGLECAFYWDSKYPIPMSSPIQYTDAFATSTDHAPTPRTISCAGVSMTDGDNINGTTTITTMIGGGGDSDPMSRFGFVMNQGADPIPHCAIVTVTKYYDGPRLWTYIKSRGYNTCDASNPKRVERGIEVTY